MENSKNNFPTARKFDSDKIPYRLLMTFATYGYEILPVCKNIACMDLSTRLVCVYICTEILTRFRSRMKQMLIEVD